MFWKYAAALEESTSVLILSRLSTWIFSHIFAAHLQIRLSLDRHGMGTVSENTTLHKIIPS